MDDEAQPAPANWVSRSLDYCYDSAVNSTLGGFQQNCDQLAEEYAKQGRDADGAIDNLIGWQCAKTGLTGFASGLPGILALPVTVPADLVTLWYVQLRMVAAIGRIYGFDPKEDRVRTLAYASLLGSSAQEALSKVGVEIGTKAATSALRRMPATVFVEINKAVGFRLATKFGQKGAVNLVKLIPLAGGVVGGVINVAGTRIVGKTAKKLLRPESIEPSRPATP
jgi:uncharacterized protein (DUF697 family)